MVIKEENSIQKLHLNLYREIAALTQKRTPINQVHTSCFCYLGVGVDRQNKIQKIMPFCHMPDLDRTRTVGGN